MKSRIIILIFFSILISCTKEDEYQVQNIDLSRDNLGVNDSTILYFPIGMIISEKSVPPIDLDTLTVRSFSKFLNTFKEAKLFNSSLADETYRFLWLRSFHEPIMIKVTNSSAGKYLIWKRSDGAGGFRPGKLIESKSRKLREEEWNNFLVLLNKANFWEMESIDHNERVPDGASWLLEGLKNNRYYIVERQNGGANINYKKCCTYLIELTDLKIDKIY